MNERYYDPETERFINQDTYRGAGEAFWHLYLYCNSGPVNNADSSGYITADKKLVILGLRGDENGK
jgi:RHS repeat-associated protein